MEYTYIVRRCTHTYPSYVIYNIYIYISIYIYIMVLCYGLMWRGLIMNIPLLAPFEASAWPRCGAPGIRDRLRVDANA